MVSKGGARCSEEVYAPCKSKSTHPLFPGVNEEIHLITFRKRVNGKIEYCPEDFPADKFRSWEDVIAILGGGEYQAIAKNERYELVAIAPSAEYWLYFSGEWSKKPAPRRALDLDPTETNYVVMGLIAAMDQVLRELYAVKAAIAQRPVGYGQC